MINLFIHLLGIALSALQKYHTASSLTGASTIKESIMFSDAWMWSDKFEIGPLKRGRWTLHCQAIPFSGGLHPSELYLLFPPGLIQDDKVSSSSLYFSSFFHFWHSFEMNIGIGGSIDGKLWSPGSCPSGSSHTRHLMGSLAVSAKMLSWNASGFIDYDNWDFFDNLTIWFSSSQSTLRSILLYLGWTRRLTFFQRRLTTLSLDLKLVHQR